LGQTETSNMTVVTLINVKHARRLLACEISIERGHHGCAQQPVRGLPFPRCARLANQRFGVDWKIMGSEPSHQSAPHYRRERIALSRRRL
jgi:hypothetical protein